MHNKNIIHRDLCCYNVLIDSNDIAKISDLGSSHYESAPKQTHLGRTWSKAPELFKGASYSKKTDIYNVGLILWEMITRKRPFEKLSEDQVIFYRYRRSPHEKISEKFPPIFKKIITACWSEPDKRPDAKTIETTFIPEIEELLLKMLTPQKPSTALVEKTLQCKDKDIAVPTKQELKENTLLTSSPTTFVGRKIYQTQEISSEDYWSIVPRSIKMDPHIITDSVSTLGLFNSSILDKTDLAQDKESKSTLQPT